MALMEGGTTLSATIKDVAAMSRTSIATVSRYINGKTIKRSTQDAIENAIKVLNYEINTNARALKTNSSMLIGIIVPYLNHIYDISIVKGIQNYLVKLGYNIMLLESNDSIDEENRAVDYMLNKNVNGIIINSDTNNTKMYEKIQSSGTPVVLIDQLPDNIKANAVIADNVNAIYQVVEHLIKMGHKRISIILGNEDSFTTKERLKGYERALEDYNIDIDRSLIKYGNYKTDCAYEKMKELLNNGNITAVITTNYDMTHGAILAINEMDVSIPDDISFIGYDDISIAKIYKPQLSVIMQPMLEIGQKAAEIIIKSIREKGMGQKNELFRLKTSFIQGKSIKRI